VHKNDDGTFLCKIPVRDQRCLHKWLRNRAHLLENLKEYQADRVSKFVSTLTQPSPGDLDLIQVQEVVFNRRKHWAISPIIHFVITGRKGFDMVEYIIRHVLSSLDPASLV